MLGMLAGLFSRIGHAGMQAGRAWGHGVMNNMRNGLPPLGGGQMPGGGGSRAPQMDSNWGGVMQQMPQQQPIQPPATQYPWRPDPTLMQQDDYNIAGGRKPLPMGMMSRYYR